MFFFLSEVDRVEFFSQKMVLIVEMSNLIAMPHLKRLDLTDVVKMLRSHIFEILPRFTGLRVLLLGTNILQQHFVITL